jgi:hypothetical protein
MKCLISTSGTSRSVISGGEQEGVRDETWQFDVNGGFARPFRLFDGVKSVMCVGIFGRRSRTIIHNLYTYSELFA